MRTTITIDDDVAAQLEELRSQKDVPFKQIVNDLLRAGLAYQDRAVDPPRGPFTKVVSLGKPRLPNVDDVTETLTTVEGDDYR